MDITSSELRGAIHNRSQPQQISLTISSLSVIVCQTNHSKTILTSVKAVVCLDEGINNIANRREAYKIGCRQIIDGHDAAL